MLGVFANDHYLTLALDDFALLANSFYRRPYFHLITSIGLFMPERYPSLSQIVNGNFHGYGVALHYLDVVHTHFAGNMSRYDMAVGKFYLEPGIRKNFRYHTFKFNNIFFSQNESLR